MEDTMRVTIRGARRNQGEKEIMDAELENAETVTGSFRAAWDGLYLQVDKRKPPPYGLHLAKVRIYTTTPGLRLGGTYFLTVELSHYEIAELFYKTHHGEMVRMIRSFIEGEQRGAGALE
jgi:hypothetical protein